MTNHDQDAEVVGPGGRAGGNVRRVDDRLGLAVERVGLSGRTLVTYARDHVTVRTPSRPDFRDGNSLDLVAPPQPDDLPTWIERFEGTIGQMGVRHVQLRWETEVDRGSPAMAPQPDRGLVAATRRFGMELHATTVHLLDDLVAPPAVSAELTAVEAPSAVPGGAVDRRWHAATVLYRYVSGETPDDWRASDEAFTAWSIDVQRELAAAERAQVWIAVRHGGPVARLTVVHDRQGLAAVEDVVVHPVHRRIGIAAALTHRGIAVHLEQHPESRVGIGAEPGSSADRLYRRLGFRPHATVWTALRPAAS